MPERDKPIEYTCQKCGYENSWTRDEILQRGEKVIYRGENEDTYTLLCKGGCGERMRIAVQRQEP